MFQCSIFKYLFVLLPIYNNIYMLLTIVNILKWNIFAYHFLFFYFSLPFNNSQNNNKEEEKTTILHNISSAPHNTKYILNLKYRHTREQRKAFIIIIITWPQQKKTTKKSNGKRSACCHTEIKWQSHIAHILFFF